MSINTFMSLDGNGFYHACKDYNKIKDKGDQND